MDSVLIEALIKNFVNNSLENSLRNGANDKAWGNPLVGFSSGDDHLYQFYKRDIGGFYWTPLDIFEKTFSDLKTTSDELTVISWVLPHNSITKSDSRRETLYPCERWARARTYGEEFNVGLRKHLVKALEELGHRALAPVLSPFWGTKVSERYGLASPWSERHAAYASGLGTFSLCDGLITPVGKAMRCGSVIVHVKIPPTPRPYSKYRSYCLYSSRGTCGRCIERCPAGAIAKTGHDKAKCDAYLNITRDYVMSHFGFESYGCGLCQTDVPCESKIP